MTEVAFFIPIIMQKRTIYTLPKDTEITGKIIAKVINDNKANLDIYTKLESYVDDDPQMERDRPNELLTIHNFAQYITSINGGYLLGNPVDYKSDGKAIDPIMEAYHGQSISELDSDLEEDCSMFGQAFENIFTDEDGKILSAKLSVFNTVVVYDDTFKHNKMFAVYYANLLDSNGKAINEQYDVTIWTDTQIMNRTLNKDSFSGEEIDSPHFFGEVPVIHYLNNKRMKGDYEPVISLIDAYNILQSDRVIDREKLVDAILAFYGAKLTEEDRQAIKDNRVVGLPEGAKAEYLIKSINEADTDVLRATLAADIHKFSMTPDLTDETFGNSPSGVSILYKLLAFEQNIKRKERQFEAALRDRFRVYKNVMSTSSRLSGTVDVNKVNVVFKRSLPKNDFETSQMINNLDGTVDQETLVGQLSFVEDASVVVKKAKDEKAENVQDFATQPFTPVGGGSDE